MARKTQQAETRGGIDADTLRQLIRTCDGHKANMDEARGELGAAVKTAEDDHGINRKAFKLAMSLMRQEPEKRADFIRSFDDYTDKLGLRDQADLFAAPKGDTAGTSREDRNAALDAVSTGEANAARIKSGIRSLN